MRRAFVVVAVTALVAAHPAGTRVAASPAQQARVPILMYHVVAKTPAGAPYPELFVSPSAFAAQMAALAARGYRAVTLDRVYDSWHGGAGLPRRPVVITFDDGSASIRRNALPVLRRLDWPGVLNLKLDNVRSSGGITPAQVRALLEAGWEVDSHTISHPDLTSVSDAALEREVAGARWRIQRQFHVPANFFCYPAGRYDARVIAAVRAAGYRGATSTRSGLGRPQELFTLARVRVGGGDGARDLVERLTALGG